MQEDSLQHFVWGLSESHWSQAYRPVAKSFKRLQNLGADYKWHRQY